MAPQQAVPLSGYKPNAERPVVDAPPVELTSESLPIRFNFKGRKYVVLETQNGRLVMNGVKE